MDIRLKENLPLNTVLLERLITDPKDLNLVWPEAKFPFDHGQWREVLDPRAGNRPFLVYRGNTLVGSAALRATDNPEIYFASFLYLSPAVRGQGRGKDLLSLLEDYAGKVLFAKRLNLVVRAYNPRAFKCYLKCGFKVLEREGSLIRMGKNLHRENERQASVISHTSRSNPMVTMEKTLSRKASP